MKILICGLPGSGKTTLAKCLSAKLNADWFNADEVRATYDDWDFSESGRIRQAKRMSTLADKSQADHTLCDFVAPTQATREAFNADFTVWVDTISASRFDDTNNIFEVPSQYNVRVTTKDAAHWAGVILEEIE